MRMKQLQPVVFLILSVVSTFSQVPPSFNRLDIATGLPLSGNVVVGDFNGDRKADIAVTIHSTRVAQGIYLLLGNGDGTFSAPTKVLNGCCSGLTAADLNRDGKLDLLFGDGIDLAVLLGNGDGTFQPPKLSSAVPSYRSPLVADFNRDGKLDVALVSQGGGISVLLGNGDGTFGPVNTFPITGDSLANGVAAGDFNNDGILDLAATNPGPGPNFLGTIVSILLGNGDGTFGPPTDFTVGSDPFPVVAADFNADGKVDLAVGNYRSASVSVLLGQGDGTFLPKMDFLVDPSPTALNSADFNGDGKLDLALSSGITALSVLSGNGDGTFALLPDFPAANTIEGLAIGDFNSDGRPDVVAACTHGTLSIFLNTTVRHCAVCQRISGGVFGSGS